MRKSEIDG